ncbi:hypothetical protein [Chitinophaga sp. 212800010-3]|uniref:hypothetical protein n=1 Tax=unclassified Chitinophaga TaxID=2619133 RepID=UPI002DE4BF88|nr:DUF4157 domain-containing protein [Chitinophaga sp. 212800010-3]
MKYLILCFLLLFAAVAGAQELVTYRDSVNRFSVGIPAGWRIIKNIKQPSIKLMALAVPADSTQKATGNFNINVIAEPSANPDTIIKKLLSYTSLNPYFRILDSGSIVQQRKRMIWLDEVHKNTHATDTVFASLYVSWADGKAYILTATAPVQMAAQYKDLFHQIGSTFKTGKAIKHERLKIILPGNKPWNKIMDSEADNLSTRQYLPPGETIDHWTMLLHEMTMENARINDINLAIQNFSNAAAGQSPQAKITILGKENIPGRRWALFKIETPEFPGGKAPESQLFYVIQGKQSFHAAFIAKHEKTLSPAFVKTWGELLRKGRIVEE